MEKEGKALLAIGYASIERFGDMHDLDRQADQIYDYCQENGITLNLVLSEEGRGRSWQIVEELVRRSEGQVDMVVVAEMDILSRDVGWLLLKQAEFESKYGAEIVSAKGSQLSLDKDGGMSMG